MMPLLFKNMVVPKKQDIMVPKETYATVMGLYTKFGNPHAKASKELLRTSLHFVPISRIANAMDGARDRLNGFSVRVLPSSIDVSLIRTAGVIDDDE